jgi:hypothetical protein
LGRCLLLLLMLMLGQLLLVQRLLQLLAQSLVFWP